MDCLMFDNEHCSECSLVSGESAGSNRNIGSEHLFTNWKHSPNFFSRTYWNRSWATNFILESSMARM